MKLAIIVAMARNRVIGNKNQLPWHLPEDLKHFKQTTMGHTIVMGRKTYESIGRPLPGRNNIVLTRNQEFQAQGVSIIHNLNEILHAKDIAENEEIFIIGGAQLYTKALPHTETLYLTLIDRDFAGDTHFPEIDLHNDFKIIEESELKLSTSSELPYRFIKAIRSASSA